MAEEKKPKDEKPKKEPLKKLPEIKSVRRVPYPESIYPWAKDTKRK